MSQFDRRFALTDVWVKAQDPDLQEEAAAISMSLLVALEAGRLSDLQVATLLGSLANAFARATTGAHHAPT